jgi:hypothetical protein
MGERKGEGKETVTDKAQGERKEEDKTGSKKDEKR